MVSWQFCKHFINTFFIKHLRCLLLPILKPLDLQGQLCKWISKLVTIYFISTFYWHFCVYFGKYKLSFYISTVLWLRKYDDFDFSRDHTNEVSRDFLGRTPSSWSSTLPSFGGHGSYECGEKPFLIFHVTL